MRMMRAIERFIASWSIRDPERARERAWQIQRRLEHLGYNVTAQGNDTLIRFSIGRDGWAITWEWTVEMLGEKTAPATMVDDMVAWAMSAWEKDARKAVESSANWTLGGW